MCPATKSESGFKNWNIKLLLALLVKFRFYQESNYKQALLEKQVKVVGKE